MHKENKLAENVQCLSLVDMWPIFRPLLSLPNLKHRRLGPLHNAKKCSSAASPRAHTGSYLDKQINTQSTLLHYRAEKLTTGTNSGNTAAAESREEQNNMNSQFI